MGTADPNSNCAPSAHQRAKFLQSVQILNSSGQALSAPNFLTTGIWVNLQPNYNNSYYYGDCKLTFTFAGLPLVSVYRVHVVDGNNVPDPTYSESQLASQNWTVSFVFDPSTNQLYEN